MIIISFNSERKLRGILNELDKQTAVDPMLC